MTKSGQTIQYAYNHSGLRVKKTVNGVDTLYTLRGKQIVHLTKGTTQMHFYYDGQGKPGLVTYNGNDYYYMYNLQGDVVGLTNPSNQWVVEYRYDPWGKPLASTGTLATTLGVDNPFRYRGYVYDVETGLYYLRSRYYNPIQGRFVNADALIVRNMFAYCVNNPISFMDSTGLYPTEATNGYEVQKLEAQEKKAHSVAIKGPATIEGGSNVGGGGSFGSGSGRSLAGSSVGGGGSFGRGGGRSFAPTPSPSPNTSWYKEDGSFNPAPHNGAIPGTEMEVTLPINKILGRYGAPREASDYVTEPGTDPALLSLPPFTNPNEYFEYVVLQSISNTTQSLIAPWGGSTGGGTQYQLPHPIVWLLNNGFLDELGE